MLATPKQVVIWLYLQVVHPAASPSRGRPTHDESLAALGADGRPQLAVLAFDQCALSEVAPDDNDINDGVFEVSATSHILDDTLLDYTVVVRPLAFGSLYEASLDVRLADIGIPHGSHIYLSNIGSEPHTVCYTYGTQNDGTAECPAMTTLRLFRSVRAAFKPVVGTYHDAKYINTVVKVPHADASHMAMMIVYPPAGTPASVALNIRLDFEMVYSLGEEASCTVRSNGLVTSGTGGFAVIVPAPFRWPVEGVPAYLEQGGICVGGDDAGEQCTERQQCPNGYCNTEKGGAQWRCIDSSGPGVNIRTSCSRASQCAYGFCYGYEGSHRSGTYAGLKQWLECVGLGCYSSSRGAHSDWCQASTCYTTALEWPMQVDVESAQDYYPLPAVGQQ